jgi:hypothetical protein
MQQVIDFNDLYCSSVENCRLLRRGNEVVEGVFCLSSVSFKLIIANIP